MTEYTSHQITLLLVDWSKGDEFALQQLMPLVNDELRQMARRYMRHQPSGHTFQTTELIHEAYLKLAGGRNRTGRTAHIFSAWRQKRCGIFWLITRGLNAARNAADGNSRFRSPKTTLFPP